MRGNKNTWLINRCCRLESVKKSHLIMSVNTCIMKDYSINKYY